MFCAPGLIFGGSEGVGSRFHVFRSRTHFRRYRGHRVSFLCFALLDTFSTKRMALSPIFMFYAPGVVFGSSAGARSRFRVLRSRSHFPWYRGRRVSFSYFARPNLFSVVLSPSGPVFMFCAPGLLFGGVECVRSLSQVLLARTSFRRYRGRPIPFSCFPFSDTFLAIYRASGLVFMFCTPGLIFDGTEGVGSRFHVLRSRKRFRRNGESRVSISCFASPDSFLAVRRTSGPVFMFCAPRLVFGGTEGGGSRFHVLRAQTRFRRYRGRRVLFSCFALPDSFSAVPSSSGPIFTFCAPRLVFGDAEFVRSLFHVLRKGRRQVPFSYFERRD
jgi:hypothetical protein